MLLYGLSQISMACSTDSQLQTVYFNKIHAWYCHFEARSGPEPAMHSYTRRVSRTTRKCYDSEFPERSCESLTQSIKLVKNVCFQPKTLCRTHSIQATPSKAI